MSCMGLFLIFFTSSELSIINIFLSKCHEEQCCLNSVPSCKVDITVRVFTVYESYGHSQPMDCDVSPDIIQVALSIILKFLPFLFLGSNANIYLVMVSNGIYMKGVVE